MQSLPFCQYAIAERLSSGAFGVLGVTNVSSRTSAASLKPASTSPYDQEVAGLPIGSRPSAYSAKSASVHFSSLTSGRGGTPAAAAPRPRSPAGAAPAAATGAAGGGGGIQALPSARGLGPPGRSDTSGATTNG